MDKTEYINALNAELKEAKLDLLLVAKALFRARAAASVLECEMLEASQRINVFEHKLALAYEI